MAQNTLKALKRRRMGKGGAREIRREGNVPAILYGKDTDPISLVINPSELKQALSTEAGENTLLEMNVEGDGENIKKLSLLREIQYDFLTSKPIHFDFLALDVNKKITVSVPVDIKGRAKGVREGGILEEIHREIAVQCLPADIPNSFAIDITNLDVGQSIHVGTLEVPEGVSVLSNEQDTIVVIHSPKVEEAEEGEEAAEPTESTEQQSSDESS